MKQSKIALHPGEQEPHFLPEVKADLPHWGKMSYWSLEEAIGLLLGQDPDYVHWDIVKDYVEWPFTTELSTDYAKLRVLVLRAFEMKEITDPISPTIFLDWAEKRGLAIPTSLRQPGTAGDSTSTNKQAEIEALLKIKDKEIAELQKKVEILEALVWQGFDENSSSYSKELAIAVKAHQAISQQYQKGKSVKTQISVWLEENHPNLFKEEKERISKICNWQKSGGAPVTP